MKYKTPTIKKLKTVFSVLSVIMLVILLSACPHSISFSDIMDGPDGQQLTINPTTAQIVRTNSIKFEVTGGAPPYIMTLETGIGGTGEMLKDYEYTAPEDVDGIVQIRVEDSYGNMREAEIMVVNSTIAPLSISPDFISIYQGQTVSFVAAGGSEPYSYALKESIDAPGESLSVNVYKSPDTIAGTAIIVVSDAEGNTKEATVSVVGGVVKDNINYNNVIVTNTGGNFGGGDLSGSFTFQNNGLDNGGEMVSWIVYCSEDTEIGSGDSIIAQGEVGPLASSQTSDPITFSGTWPFPPYQKTYYLIAAIEADDDINISDNKGYTSVVIDSVVMPNIDYLITVFDLYTNPATVGDPIGGRFRLLNQGSVNGIETVTWKLYRSDDVIWDDNDLLIDSGTSVPLNSGINTWIDITETWPAPAGEYYLILRLFIDEDINLSNNLAISELIDVIE